MTLATRLILLVVGALLCSLLAGGLLILVGAAAWVQGEVDATAGVVHDLVVRRVAEAREEGESPERLTELLQSLETAYHVRVVYRPPDNLPAPPGETPAAPSTLSRLLGVHPTVQDIPVDLPRLQAGRIVLAIDPAPEVARAWRAIEISLAAIALVSGSTLVLVALGLTRSLRPLGQLAQALSRVGSGDYSPRIDSRGPHEIALLGRRFNLMADQLLQMQARTRALNAQMLAVQEQERRELARDLHDELGPCLLAAHLDVATLVRLNRVGDRAGLEDCAGGLGAVLARMQALVRRMVGRLSLDPAATIDLGAAVADLIGFWRERCPSITWRSSLDDSCVALPAATAETLLKVAREALTNAVRHSGARRIAVAWMQEPETVVLSITDDGIGMTPDIPPGLGIAGMRDRVAAQGGTLTVTSAPGLGTVVAARLPRTDMPTAPPGSVALPVPA